MTMTKSESPEVIQAKLSEIYPVSRETMGRLTLYRDLLVKWQAKTNLVSPSTLPDFWERHVADSLQVVALKPEARFWTDLGSGGGFPGLVVAAVLADEKEAVIRLVESNQKKCAFLRQAAGQMAAPVEVINRRIESATEQIQAAEVVTARALAPLAKLLEWTGEFLVGGRTALFMKGRDFRREIEDSRGDWKLDLVEHPSRIDPAGCVLEISKASRR